MAKRTTVVLVDDDPDDRDFIKLSFEAAGIDADFHEFSDGRKALDFFESAEEIVPPCVVILDVNMPRLTGIQLLESLASSKITDRVPFILFSTTDRPLDREMGTSFGAIHVYTKPNTFVGYVVIALSLKEQLGL